MRDLKLSFVCGTDGKYTLGLTAVFDHSDDALNFNDSLVVLCKQELDGQRAKISEVDRAKRQIAAGDFEEVDPMTADNP